jgi:hypothetical protein
MIVAVDEARDRQPVAPVDDHRIAALLRLTQELRPDGGDDAVLNQHVRNSRIVVATVVPEQPRAADQHARHIHSVASPGISKAKSDARL